MNPWQSLITPPQFSPAPKRRYSRRAPSLTVNDQLVLRAERLLEDGLRHSDAAMDWARTLVDVAEISGEQFGKRELSLGAQEQW